MSTISKRNFILNIALTAALMAASSVHAKEFEVLQKDKKFSQTALKGRFQLRSAIIG